MRMPSILRLLPLLTIWALFMISPLRAEDRIKAMILTGQMNKPHNPELMDQVLSKYLRQTGLFSVDIVRTPAQGKDMSGFFPDFNKYDLVVLNYDGDDWPKANREAFINWVHSGGALVTVHSTNNAFPDWVEFNEMIGLGGWGGRDERWGPAVYWRDGQVIRDTSPGETFHPPKHDYRLTIRDTKHPVTQGLPKTWMHAHDELYSRLRGPAQSLNLLATGIASPNVERASGEHEPVIFTVRYGEGRIFHTTLGHINRNAQEPPASVRCVGFITTFQRGSEWAATGNVTQKIPPDFPSASAPSLRP